MVAHEKRNPAQLFCAVPTQNDLALSSLLFSAHPTQKLGYPKKLWKRLAFDTLRAYNTKVSEFIPERKGSYLCRTRN